MRQSFHETCRWAFRGWSQVDTIEDLDHERIRVRLTLDREMLEGAPMDISELQEKLFAGTDAWRLVEMARRQKSRLGLRRYGRNRR